MEDNNMEEDDDHSSSSEEEEEAWFDIMVRRPEEPVMIREWQQLPKPTEVFISNYPEAGSRGEDLKLVFKGYSVNSEEAMISSGLTEWGISEVLCKHLIHLTDMESDNILELGSGLGKCGLVAYHALNARYGNTVLTDGDTNTMQLLQKNVAFNTSHEDGNRISCQQLKWGRRNAKTFLSSMRDRGINSFGLIIGSDLLYTNETNIHSLFETVDELLEKRRGRFILAHNEDHLVPVKLIVQRAALRHNLVCEVLKQEKAFHILCFRRPDSWRVNNTMEKLQDEILELKSKVRTLELDKSYAEDLCLKLDKRCTVLRGNENLPESILVSFDEDNLASILSFLEPQDFAQLASTCKFFGESIHSIGDGPLVSFAKRIAHKLYEDIPLQEKKLLPVYQNGKSPFFFYNELIKLRKPRKFDRLIGIGIQHAIGDESVIRPKLLLCPPKMPWTPDLNFFAFTAVSDHVMRAGKHYVTFTCNHPINADSDDEMRFGIVRPLNQYTPETGLFTPFCKRWAYQLRRLKCPDWGDCNIHSCVYKVKTGQCQSTDWDDSRIEPGDGGEYFQTDTWEGMQMFEGCGKIGLLLDYDEGTLTVYKNDIKLGVMKEGLSGAYCWMVTVGTDWDESSNEDNEARIKIERGQPPEQIKSLKRKDRE